MSDVFLSYASSDEPRAEVVARLLRSEGLTVWWAPEKIRSGRFAEQIEQELEGARCVVVLWSENTVESDWVPAEADRGRIGNKLVQLRLDSGCQVPLPFEWLHLLELTQWDPEPTTEACQELLEAVRLEVSRPPLSKKIRRIWKPSEVPKLRPWDMAAGMAVLALAVATLASWAVGFLNHWELVLYGAGIFAAWFIWVLLRALLLLWLAGRPLGSRMVSRAVGAAATLAALWAGGFYAVYSIPSFDEGVSGFYVARLQNDRWDFQRNSLVRELKESIPELGIEPELQVERLPRRVYDRERARELLEETGAALLVRGTALGASENPFAATEYQVSLRRTPGIFTAGERVEPQGASGAVRSNATKREFLAQALAQFFAGYTLYQAGEFDLAADQFEPALETLKQLEEATGPSEISADGRIGVTESLVATVALFLGNCLLMEEDPERALEHYEQAIAASTEGGKPRYIEALINKAWILRPTRLDEAVAALDQGENLCRRWAPERNRERPEALSRWFVCAYLHHNLGIARVMQGEHEQGRGEFVRATEFAEAAQVDGPQEDLLSLEAFNLQKASWAWAKEYETRLVSGSEGSRDATSLLDRAEADWQRAASFWRDHLGEPLPAGFRVTRARISIASENWDDARSRLERLREEGAGGQESEVFLLLAIAQACTEDLEGSGHSMGAFAIHAMLDGNDPKAGRAYYTFWTARCT